MDNHDRVRALPLEAVLASAGAQRDPTDPAHNWRLGGSRITVTGQRFFDHNAAGATHRLHGRAGGGGAIDLMQYLHDVDVRDAVRQLVGVKNLADLPPPERTENSVGLTPATHRLGRARWYLIAVRALPEALVDDVISSGRVFADSRGNVVFRLQDEIGRAVGYEIRGTAPDKPFHGVHGTKGLFVVHASAARIATFVESAIEALSYQALKQAGLVVSTTGSGVELPARFGQHLRARGFTLQMGFNADRAGDAQTLRLTEKLGGERVRPPVGKDWNDALRAQRATALAQSDPLMTR